jgi:ATP-binding cassette, subfamily B, bacterial HlyB/CyaB
MITNASIDIKKFFTDVFPFKHLPENVLENLLTKVQFLRYRMGQVIATREAMPEQISIIYSGQVRLLGLDKRTEKPDTLKLLQSGEVVGWVSHVRGVACETAIASKEVICFNLASADFLSLLKRESAFAKALHQNAALVEVHELLGEELSRRADGKTDLVKLSRTAWEDAIVLTLGAGKVSKSQLDPQRLWLVSSDSLAEFPVGSCFELDSNPKLHLNATMRLVGLPKSLFPALPESPATPTTADSWLGEIPYAPEIAKPESAVLGGSDGGDADSQGAKFGDAISEA